MRDGECISYSQLPMLVRGYNEITPLKSLTPPQSVGAA
jgi:hypothetical protein